MSDLSDFSRAAHDEAQAIIGTESLTIGGGNAVTATVGEMERNRESDMGGFEKVKRTVAVVDSVEILESYPTLQGHIGSLATFKNETWRVDSFREGAFFTEVVLIDQEESA